MPWTGSGSSTTSSRVSSAPGAKSACAYGSTCSARGDPSSGTRMPGVVGSDVHGHAPSVRRTPAGLSGSGGVARTSRTGTEARRTTASATLPRNQRGKPAPAVAGHDDEVTRLRCTDNGFSRQAMSHLRTRLHTGVPQLLAGSGEAVLGLGKEPGQRFPEATWADGGQGQFQEHHPGYVDHGERCTGTCNRVARRLPLAGLPRRAPSHRAGQPGDGSPVEWAHLVRSHEEDGHRGVPHDRLGHAPEKPASRPAAAVRGHDEQIPWLCGGKQFLRGRTLPVLDGYRRADDRADPARCAPDTRGRQCARPPATAARPRHRWRAGPRAVCRDASGR